MSIKIKCIQ